MLLAAIRLDDLDLMDIALALELEPKLETTGFAFATCDDRFEFIIFGVTAHCTAPMFPNMVSTGLHTPHKIHEILVIYLSIPSLNSSCSKNHCCPNVVKLFSTSAAIFL